MSNDVLACFEKARIAVDLASSSQCQGQVITEVQVAKRQAVFIPSAVSSVFHGVTALNLQDDATGETWSCNLGRHDQQRGTQTVVSYSIPSAGWRTFILSKNITGGDHVFFTVKRSALPHVRLIVFSTVSFAGMPSDERMVTTLNRKQPAKRRRAGGQAVLGTDTPSPTHGGARARSSNAMTDDLMGTAVLRWTRHLGYETGRVWALQDTQATVFFNNVPVVIFRSAAERLRLQPTSFDGARIMQTVLLDDGRTHHMHGRVKYYLEPLNRFAVVYEDGQSGFLTFEELLTVLVYSEQWDWEKAIQGVQVGQRTEATEGQEAPPAAETQPPAEGVKRAALEQPQEPVADVITVANPSMVPANPSTPPAQRVADDTGVAGGSAQRRQTAVRSIPLEEPPHPDGVSPQQRTLDDVRGVLAQQLPAVLQRLSEQQQQSPLWRTLKTQHADAEVVRNKEEPQPAAAAQPMLPKPAPPVADGSHAPCAPPRRIVQDAATVQRSPAQRARPTTPPEAPQPPPTQPNPQHRDASTSIATTIGPSQAAAVDDRVADVVRTMNLMVERMQQLERRMEQPRHAVVSPAAPTANTTIDVSSRLLALETAVAARDAEVALLRQKVLVAEGTAARFESKCELLQAQLAERGRLRKEVTETLQTMTVVAPLLMTAAARAAQQP